jgi:hypothetical protein
VVFIAFSYPACRYFCCLRWMKKHQAEEVDITLSSSIHPLSQPHIGVMENDEYARNSQYFATAKKLRESIEKFFK